MFLLTDGEVSSTEQVIEAAAKTNIRFFTIGVGDSPSRALIDGIARITGGKSEFVTNDNEINDIIIRQLNRSISYYFTDVSIEWEGFQSKAEGFFG